LSMPGGSLFTKTSFEHAKRVIKMGEGGTGPVMIVGASGIIRTVYDTFSRMDRRATSNIHFTSSVEDARARLAAMGYAYDEEAVPMY
jgi:hypothetical protein